MVTVLVGAVAIGIVSACAIPFGCFVSRRFKRKVIIPPEVVDLPEPSPAELPDDCRYGITPLASKPNTGRSGRVRIRVLVSNGSPRSMDLENQAYVTASGVTETSSARAIEARERTSLPNPATTREIQGGSCSLPAAIPPIVYNASGNRGRNDYSESTRFEITISGGNNPHFGDFKNDVQDSSTPKSRQTSSAPSATDCSERVDNRSVSWGRDSIGGNGPPKALKSTREIGIINIEIMPEDELRDKEKPEVEPAATVSQENGRNFDRGRWGLRGRFLETLKETTSFANL